MNEFNSKIVEYTLVILIGLIISYVIFAQAQYSKNEFNEMDKRVTELEKRLEDVNIKNTVHDVKLKELDGKVNPPAVDEKTDGTEIKKEVTPEEK